MHRLPSLLTCCWPVLPSYVSCWPVLLSNVSCWPLLPSCWPLHVTFSDTVVFIIHLSPPTAPLFFMMTTHIRRCSLATDNRHQHASANTSMRSARSLATFIASSIVFLLLSVVLATRICVYPRSSSSSVSSSTINSSATLLLTPECPHASRHRPGDVAPPPGENDSWFSQINSTRVDRHCERRGCVDLGARGKH